MFYGQKKKWKGENVYIVEKMYFMYFIVVIFLKLKFLIKLRVVDKFQQ